MAKFSCLGHDANLPELCPASFSSLPKLQLVGRQLALLAGMHTHPGNFDQSAQNSGSALVCGLYKIGEVVADRMRIRC